MAKLKVKLNSSGVRQYLKTSELKNVLSGLAADMAAAAGTGYASEVKYMGTRVIASAYTESPEAAADEARHGELRRQVKPGG